MQENIHPFPVKKSPRWRARLDQGWHPQDIIAAIRKSGTSLQRLGLKHGFARTTFNTACTKLCPRAHDIIAAHLGHPRQSIWPQFYDEDGRVLHGGRLTRRRSA